MLEAWRKMDACRSWEGVRELQVQKRLQHSNETCTRPIVHCNKPSWIDGVALRHHLAEPADSIRGHARAHELANPLQHLNARTC